MLIPATGQSVLITTMEQAVYVRTLISTGRSSNSVFRLATTKSVLAAPQYILLVHARCPSFPSLIDVLLISFAIPVAILVNSDLVLPSFPCDCSRRCFASARAGKDDLFRMDSTQALNSFVRSCTGIVNRVL